MRKFIEMRLRPGEGKDVLACVSDDGHRTTLIYSSDDAGATAREVPAPGPVRDLAVCGQTWALLIEGALAQSNDRGATWQRTLLPGSAWNVAASTSGWWVTAGRELLAIAGNAVQLAASAPGLAHDEVLVRVYTSPAGTVVCSNQQQVFAVDPGASVLVPWSDGLPPPSRGTLQLSWLDGVWSMGTYVRRPEDPRWHEVASGVPVWASQLAPLLAVPFTTWTAAPWAPATWIGRDAIRVLEARAGETAVRELWRRPDTWTLFSPDSTAGSAFIALGLLRTTPQLGGLLVDAAGVREIGLPAGSYDRF